MSFSKNDLDTIKSKIQLSSELEKRVKVIKKGKDHWCCCPFHEEKTPSCKINDDLGSYYCFGCGAKGDIFTIYTELYNFSFPDAVKELAQRVGIKISDNNFQQNKENEVIYKILEDSTQWFENNLIENDYCVQYLKNRSLSQKTIKDFRIGYSYNSKSSLYKFLKDQNFKDEDILKSNVVKIDNNKNIKDFFYKRLIFPISNEQNKIVGFGGRVLDNSNPKYINSPESYFFKKRNILYNLNKAKQNIRSKNNMLICEGYMDVISLYEKNIKTAVAPLGTALTEIQLLLAWKYVKKPTIMFDGDDSGIRASYKSALMALSFLSPDKYLQFIRLPKDHDPDSFINKNSLEKFIKILKNPISIVHFIFEQASSSINLKDPDNKISFDKYMDDIIDTIKDTKIKYFYKNEFKNLFFNKLKSKNKLPYKFKDIPKITPLNEKQVNSFLAAYINHKEIREDLFNLLKDSKLLNNNQDNFLSFLNENQNFSLDIDKIEKSDLPEEISTIIDKIMENSIFQLFPYANKNYDYVATLQEIQDSIKNLNTRLSNLKKINKSLDEFEDNSNKLSWDELKKISVELHNLDKDSIE